MIGYAVGIAVVFALIGVAYFFDNRQEKRNYGWSKE